MKKKDKKKIGVYALLLLIAITIYTYLVYREYHTILAQQIEEEATVFVDAARQIDLHLNETMVFIYGLRGFVNSQLGDGISQNEFETFAQETQLYGRYIKNFSIAPNNIQRYVYPIAGNEVTLGHNLAEDKRENVRNDVLAAMTSGQIIMSGPYELRQGNLGMVLRNPIYDENIYWGLVNVVVDVENIINDSVSTSLAYGLSMELSSNDQVFYKSGKLNNGLQEYLIKFSGGQWLVKGDQSTGLNGKSKQLLVRYGSLYLLIVSLIFFIISRIIANNFILSYKIKGLIYNDTLTDLPNRRALDAQIDNYIKSSTPFALGFLDLDNFKDINDMLGHSIGDEVLIEMTRRIQNTNQYRVYRWGGDEFIIIKESSTPKKFQDIMESIASKINAPIYLNGESYTITSSTGITFFPRDGRTKDEIIKLADATMYIAKKNGKNKILMYSNEIGLQLKNTHAVERKLETALRNNELEVHYQPQYDFKTMGVNTVEALIRWRDENDNYISPSIFVPLAEEMNIIDRIDEYVLETVAHQIREWRQDGLDLKVAVNISAKHFTTSLMKYMTYILSKYELESNVIELEITETAAISNFEYTKDLINNLNDMNIKIALDDFGTGFSSLNYLSKLKLSILKIDRVFISKVDQHSKEYTIVKSIIEITKDFNLKTIAEGVETKEQMETVKELGCDAYQGYYLAKPLPADMMIKWLNEPLKEGGNNG